MPTRHSPEAKARLSSARLECQAAASLPCKVDQETFSQARRKLKSDQHMYHLQDSLPNAEVPPSAGESIIICIPTLRRELVADQASQSI